MAVLAVCSLWPAAARTYVIAAAVDVNSTLKGYAERNVRLAVSFFTRQGVTDIRQLYGREVTREALIGAFRQVAAEARGDDEVFFVYAGHGYVATSIHHGGITTADAKGYLGYDEIQELLSRLGVGKKVAFINSCYSGGLTAPKKRSKLKRSVLPPARARVKADVMLYLSSKADEPSYLSTDGEDFLSTVIRGLEGRADTNADSYVTARELFNYVNPIILKKFGVHPQMWGRFDDNLRLSKVKPAVRPPFPFQSAH